MLLPLLLDYIVTTMKILINRWIQLVLMVICFFVISGPQYLWALFVKPFLEKFGVPLSQLQIVFSVVLVCMTFITPLAGYFQDRFKSRHVITFGLIVCSSSWILASFASSMTLLFFTYGILGGLGAGITFIGCTGTIQKNFSDKRGFATGILMSGYALGPLLTTPFVAKSLQAMGVEATMLMFGQIFLVISIVLAFLLRTDAIEVQKVAKTIRQKTGLHAKEMLQTPIFWVMFAMMAIIAATGMMITSNIAIISKEYGIGSEIYLFGLAALPLALMIDRIMNGISRVLFGSISDRLGRENTLALAFFLEAIFVGIWFKEIRDPAMFILLSGLVFLAWGEIFSIFPALCTDIFGEKHASFNFGFLYASVGVGSILGGPLAAWLRESYGSWNPVFTIVITLDLITAFTALFILKRMRLGHKTLVSARTLA